MKSRIEDKRWVIEPGQHYRIPAVLCIEAESPADAANKAENLSTTLKASYGPGAFFYGIAVETAGDPEEA